MIYYSIKREGKYLQDIESNEKYCPSSKAPTMGTRHDVSEFKSIWGDDPHYFEKLTTANYLKVIFEEARWGDIEAKTIEIIPEVK